MRLIKEKSFKYGLNDIAVEAKDEATLDRLVVKINSLGWKDEWGQCGQDCDYGFATNYAIRSTSFDDFNDSFKEAKAELAAEMKAEAQLKAKAPDAVSKPYIGTIGGVKTLYSSSDQRGHVSFDGEALYLFDEAIGTSITFAADGKIKTGKITRINCEPTGSNEAVNHLSVDDDTETWVNDEGVRVPVNWSVRLGEFELSPPMSGYQGLKIQNAQPNKSYCGFTEVDEQNPNRLIQHIGKNVYVAHAIEKLDRTPEPKESVTITYNDSGLGRVIPREKLQAIAHSRQIYPSLKLCKKRHMPYRKQDES